MRHEEDTLPVDAARDLTPPLPMPPSAIPRASADAALEDAVNYVLDDCFFSVGQAVADRKTVDHAAVMWWRDHFRDRFLRTMRRSGNTWLTDRRRVTAVGRLLADRAVRYAGDRPSIDLASAMKAAADVQAYCTRRADVRRRRLGPSATDASTTMYAGYWCMP